MADSLDFTFSAFGLLLDNIGNNAGTFVDITLEAPLRSYDIIIKDNASITWDEKEFFDTMRTFSAGPTTTPSNLDKKTKAHLLR